MQESLKELTDELLEIIRANEIMDEHVNAAAMLMVARELRRIGDLLESSQLSGRQGS